MLVDISASSEEEYRSIKEIENPETLPHIDLFLLHALNATHGCPLKFLYRKIEGGDYQDENGGAKGRTRNRRSHDVGSEEQNLCKACSVAMAMDAIASSPFFVPFRQPSRLTFVFTSSSFVPTIHVNLSFISSDESCSRPGHLRPFWGLCGL